MLAGQGLFFRADSLMGLFSGQGLMVARFGDSFIPRQKLPVMFGNDNPTVINHYPLPILVDFDVFADQSVGYRVAVGVEMDVSLDIYCPLLGKIDRRQNFRQGVQRRLFYQPSLRRTHSQAALWFAVGYLLAPCLGLEVKIMPVGEGSTGQEVSFYIVKWPLDPGFSVSVVNPMRPKTHVVDPGEGLHFRGKRGIRAGAVADNHAGVIDHTALAGTLHIRHGLGQEGFTFKPGKPRVVLDKELTAIGQGKAGTLGGKETVAYFESMWRGVMLHLRAWRKIIAPGPLLRRDAQLIFTDQPGEALVGDGDIITG